MISFCSKPDVLKVILTGQNPIRDILILILLKINLDSKVYIHLAAVDINGGIN